MARPFRLALALLHDAGAVKKASAHHTGLAPAQPGFVCSYLAAQASLFSGAYNFAFTIKNTITVQLFQQ